MKASMSLRSNLLLLLLTLIVPILAVQAATYYDRFQSRHALQLEVNLDLARVFAHTMSALTEDIFRQELAIGAALGPSHRLGEDEIQKVLLLNKGEYPIIAELDWVNPEGKVTASTCPGKTGRSVEDSAILSQVLAGHDKVVGDLIEPKGSERPVFAVSRAKRGHEGGLEGVVVAWIDPESLESSFTAAKVPGGSISLLDRRGRLVFRYPRTDISWEDRDYRKAYPGIEKAFQGQETTSSTYSDMEGKWIMTALCPIPSIGWVAGMGIPENEALGPVIASLKLHSGLFSMVVLLAFLAATALARGITSSINGLREHALRMGRGEPGRPVAVAGPAEVRDLVRAFNRMAEKVRERESALIAVQNDLERRVEERTADLSCANQALHDTVELFQKTFSSQLDGILILDNASPATILNCNPAVEEIFGYSQRDLVGDTTLRLHVAEGSAHEFRERVHEAIAEHGYFYAPEIPMRRKNGEVFASEQSVVQLVNDAGKHMGWVNVVRDISERKRVENALRESEEKYRELVECANSIIMRMDAEGRITFVNEFALGFFGYSREEFLGRSPIGLIRPERNPSSRERPAIFRDMTHRPDRYINTESRNVRKNGEKVWVAWTNRAIVDASGQVCGVLSIGNDITERKRAQEALRLDEARLEALYALSQMTEASRKEIEVFVLEQEQKVTRSKIGFICYLNEEETGFTVPVWSPTVREHCAVRDEPLHFPLAQAGLWAEAVRKRQPVIFNDFSDPSLPRKGYPEGHVSLKRLMVVPVFDGDRIVAVAAVANKEEAYDASDTRQLSLLMDGMWKHIRRRKAEKELQETQGLAAIGRALSAVAHDMKTPLVAIGGFAQMVQRHLSNDDPDHARLGIVISETRRLEKMVKEMLDFSRPVKLERSAGNIREFLTECVTVVEPMARSRNVTLLDRSPSEPTFASMDSARMKQVIINLLTNAVQASQEGDTVFVSTRHEEHQLVLEVTDGGCGIPHEQRDEIFSPFFTTKKEGTGLGLPIIKRIVEAHNGRVEIVDNPERGVTFRVLLPGDNTASDAFPAPGKEAPAGSSSS